jgi:hypothetical protein
MKVYGFNLYILQFRENLMYSKYILWIYAEFYKDSLKVNGDSSRIGGNKNPLTGLGWDFL